MLSMWVWVVAAWGATFPEGPLDDARAVGWLTPANLGAPAQTYDHLSSPGAYMPLEGDVAAALFGARAKAPPAGLVRYARAFAALRLLGEPGFEHVAFLSEHFGLYEPPETFGYFCSTESNPATLADLARPYAAAAASDASGALLGVGLTHWEGGGWCGAVVRLDDEVHLDPFPRTIAPAGHVTLVGEFRGRGELRALWVNQPGLGVETYPFPATGIFHLGVPAPGEPGVYRAATNRVQRGALPDTPTYFSFYVGVDPPDHYEPPPRAAGAGGPLDPAAAEAAFIAELNRFRAAYDLRPFTVVGDPARLRALLASLPSGERARYRTMTRYFKDDPLPEVFHGSWGAGLSSAGDPTTAAWWATQHPVLRADAGSAAMDAISCGVAAEGSGVLVVYLTADSEIEGPDPREATRELLAARWVGPAPRPAPKLEAALDTIAVRVATEGLSLKRALAEIGKLGKDPNLLRAPYSTVALVGAMGQPPDVSTINPPAGMRMLAVGSASGVIEGSTAAATVFLVVMAYDAK